VPPSANAGHLAHRSNDGHVIFEVPSKAPELGPDLLFCGAPLRNRTVDLLLTIDKQCVAVTAAEALSRPDAGPRELTQAEASAR
jgi:hypothetical protein